MEAPKERRDASKWPFFWLGGFYFVYCARPEDWIPGLRSFPLAKISAAMAVLSLFLSWGKTPRRLKDLPKESKYLLALIGLMFASALASPVWKGGALFQTINFSKVYVAWVLTFLLITTLAKLQRIIFIQSASVAIISLAAIIKGHSSPRLGGAIGGIYSNPNDLAFAIVLSIPFCLALFVNAKSKLSKVGWAVGMLVMATALFLTASRAGFIDLLISGTVCLWHFGIKGRRFYLIVAAALVGLVMLVALGGTLRKRFTAISGEDLDSRMEGTAFNSYEDRKFVINKSLEGMLEYPILGVGKENFAEYSGVWRQVHVSYLQMGVEGGFVALALYLLFFWRGFVNLRLLRRSSLDAESQLFAGALHSSLVGFVVGACFAPEAYQFFPYFTVCYTSVMAAMIKGRVEVPAKKRVTALSRGLAQMRENDRRPRVLAPTH